MKKEIEELVIEGKIYVPKDGKAEQLDGMDAVLVRATNSGVHFGYLKSEIDHPHGKEVELLNSRRVHYWDGAASLSQMSRDGIKNEENSRVSIIASSIRIMEVIEIIPLTSRAKENLYNQKIWEI